MTENDRERSYALESVAHGKICSWPFISSYSGVRMLPLVETIYRPNPCGRPKRCLFGGEVSAWKTHITITSPLYITLHLIHCWMHLLKSFHSPHSWAPGVSCVHTAVLPKRYFFHFSKVPLMEELPCEHRTRQGPRSGANGSS
jgi:hypothetical protein